MALSSSPWQFIWSLYVEKATLAPRHTALLLASPSALPSLCACCLFPSSCFFLVRCIFSCCCFFPFFFLASFRSFLVFFFSLSSNSFFLSFLVGLPMQRSTLSTSTCLMYLPHSFNVSFLLRFQRRRRKSSSTEPSRMQSSTSLELEVFPNEKQSRPPRPTHPAT